MKTVNVAVIGAGYWGPNLIRNFNSCPSAKLLAVCDRDADRLRKVLSGYPAVRGCSSTDELFADPEIDAVAIATPVDTHAPLALAAIAAGKHVLVEKPLAANVSDAEAMVNAARQAGRVLMVDHTFLFSSPVRKMKELLQRGELGDLNFVDSVRINLGLFQHDVNVVWDLAPHDLSIMDFLIGRLPRSLSAFGACHTPKSNGIEDVAYLNLDFGSGLLASFHVNWLSPVKIRHFIVGGSKKSIVFNDLEPSEKIRVYDRGISVEESLESRRGVLISYRTGDVWCPHLPASEPLQEMVRHFVHCIQTGDTPLSDGESGLRIVRILEAAQHSIKAQGGRITL
ncbi:MAG UNVERIFIED_CONTAM: Gfo/Idh/MocA family oxidoreductase [Planctomycetaceae bacterium]|jgi:predicted dehydrogenase